MNKREFIKAARRDGEMFRIDAVMIKTPTGEFRGKGSIRVTDAAFKINVILDAVENIPERASGVFGRSELWQISGLIEDEIQFEARDLPSCTSKSYGEHTFATLKFTCSTIDLAASGYDRLTRAEREVHFAQIIRDAKTDQNGETNSLKQNIAAGEEWPKVTFYAVLPNFKIIGRNGGTATEEKNDFLGKSTSSSLDTCHGVTIDWKFGLIQREEDAHLYLRSQPDYDSDSADEDIKRFRAFLNAVAFMHGRHAWPLLTEHWREGRLLLDRVQLHADVATTPHPPFDDRIAFSSKTQNLDWNLENALGKPYDFFRSDAKLPAEVAELLFLFREATNSGVPTKIGLLTLCSLLESLVRAIYEDQIEPLRGPEIKAFSVARRGIIQEIRDSAEKLPKEDATAYLRVAAILGDARPLTFRMIYDAVISHLGFASQERWQAVFDQWNSYRNPLAHRLTGQTKSEESFKADSIAESRLAGAINCLLLKLMNYAGVLQFSAFQEEYVKI